MRALSGPPSPEAREWSWRLLGAACVLLALQEWRCGHLDPLLFARRPGFLPLFPGALRAALWLGQAAAGAALLLAYRRGAAVRVAAAAVLLGLTQSFANQKMFLALLLTSHSLDSGREEGPGRRAAKGSLLILYAASAAFKLRDGFWDGASLSAALEQAASRGLAPRLPLPPLPSAVAAAAAAAALAAELALAVMLPLRPRAAVPAALALHAAFGLFLPGLWPFSLACASAALLFWPPPSSSDAARSAGPVPSAPSIR